MSTKFVLSIYKIITIALLLYVYIFIITPSSAVREYNLPSNAANHLLNIRDQVNNYVVWVDNATGSNGVYFRNIGASFGKTINISNNTGGSFSSQIAVASGSSNVYIAWSDTNKDILFRASTDNGASFGKTINLGNTTGDLLSPQIAVASGSSNVYIAWSDTNKGILFI